MQNHPTHVSHSKPHRFIIIHYYKSMVNPSLSGYSMQHMTSYRKLQGRQSRYGSRWRTFCLDLFSAFKQFLYTNLKSAKTKCPKPVSVLCADHDEAYTRTSYIIDRHLKVSVEIKISTSMISFEWAKRSPCLVAWQEKCMTLWSRWTMQQSGWIIYQQNCPQTQENAAQSTAQGVLFYKNQLKEDRQP